MVKTYGKEIQKQKGIDSGHRDSIQKVIVHYSWGRKIKFKSRVIRARDQIIFLVCGHWEEEVFKNPIQTMEGGLGQLVFKWHEIFGSPRVRIQVG